MGNKARFDEMTKFFEGVGTGHASGIWEDTPRDRPEFRKKILAANAASAARKAVEDPI
jgi:3,8-divinyl chlorophyllide a/chlorophyllide a reductase subunit Y